MTNGGAVIALIECLDPDNDWDHIKNEPKTEKDKVDIMLYKDGKIKSAIQVKSSIGAFGKPAVEKWLKDLRKDAKDAEKLCLCLVGDKYTGPCKRFIEENSDEIKTVPFSNLQRESTFRLIEYIKKAGLGGKVRIDDLELMDASLFSKILRNSTAEEPVSREDFEAAFRSAIPRGEELAKQIADAVAGQINIAPALPQCLTSIPLIMKETGLVGREDILKEIRKMLEENPCIVLVNGLGGIGKTAVMQEICNELKAEGHYVAWIRCGDSLQDDLLMVREALGIPKAAKADEAYRSVKSGIQQLGKKLYIFMDDLYREVTRDERDEINGLGVHVMITSRAENLPFPKKKLEYLDEDSAVKMFWGYYGGEHRDEETLRKIIRSVKCHTLLVELLAKAAKEEGGTLDEFNKNLEEGLFFVSEEAFTTEHDDENRTIEESVLRLYEISGLSEEQKRIMKLFTIFSPEKEIYYKVRDWAGFDRKEMKKLVDLGWLERGGLENGYQIHQIVRDSIAGQMEKKGEKVILEEYGDFLKMVIHTASYLGVKVTYDKVRERIVLTEDVIRFFEKENRDDAAAGDLFYNIAEAYEDQGEYVKALEYCEKALAIRERVLGPDHPGTTETYSSMAVVYDDLENYGKALEYSEKTLAIRGRILKEDHPDMAVTYNNLALIYCKQGKYEKALEYYEKALVIDERVKDSDHPSTAVTYNNMALVYENQGEYKKALEYYGKALAIDERVEGPDHPSTATTYNNMATLFCEQGEYAKALEYYGKALAIVKRLKGPDHPYTAVTYYNLALVYYDQDDYKKSLEYFKKAYAAYLSKFGENYSHTQKVKRSIMELEKLLSKDMSSDHPEDSQGQEEYPASASKGQ